MTLDEFVREFARKLDLEARLVRADSKLTEDLDLDSLDLVEALMLAEEIWPEGRWPEQLAVSDARVVDIYHYYSVSDGRE